MFCHKWKPFDVDIQHFYFDKTKNISINFDFWDSSIIQITLFHISKSRKVYIFTGTNLIKIQLLQNLFKKNESILPTNQSSMLSIKHVENANILSISYPMFLTWYFFLFMRCNLTLDIFPLEKKLWMKYKEKSIVFVRI